MAQTINTNVASLNAQRQLNSSQGSLATSLQRLSSGLRIKSAKDDAAGLAVSQRMNSQIRSLNQAVRNANDGISMLQTAEAATNEVQTMLQRMKELGTQAANDTISAGERKYINTELQQLKDEINDIAEKTKFNGQSLLTGSLSASVDATTELNVGSAVGSAASITGLDVSKAKAGATYTFTSSASNKITMSDGTTSQTLDLANIATDSSTVLDFSNLGVKVTLSSTAGQTASDTITALTAASTNDIITAAGSGSIRLQVGSNTNVGTDTLDLAFADARISSTNTKTSALNTALSTFDTKSTAGTVSGDDARALMSAVDSALDFFSNERATYGASQNRLESTIANLQTTSENLSASRGRIVDADFAAETANLTRSQILQQAGTAMLAQANSLPQNVLSLLRG